MKPPQHVVALALAMANDSPCKKSQRGAVVFDPARDNEVLGLAFNGLPAGRCDGSDRCRSTCAARCQHAEARATIDAMSLAWTKSDQSRRPDMLHIKTVDGKPVASGSPSCYRCSGLMLDRGVAAVWLLHDSGWHRYEIEEFHRLSLETHGMQP